MSRSTDVFMNSNHTLVTAGAIILDQLCATTHLHDLHAFHQPRSNQSILLFASVWSHRTSECY